jgi:hypothetical protein
VLSRVAGLLAEARANIECRALEKSERGIKVASALVVDTKDVLNEGCERLRRVIYGLARSSIVFWLLLILDVELFKEDLRSRPLGSSAIE